MARSTERETESKINDLRLTLTLDSSFRSAIDNPAATRSSVALSHFSSLPKDIASAAATKEIAKSSAIGLAE